jgi:UPF0716 protein FxsA
MSLVKWGFVALLALPLAEIAVFLGLAASIGWGWVTVFLVAPSILGMVLLRRSGKRDLARLAHFLRTEGPFALRLESPGLARILAAVLLLVPGLITDVLGAILLVPAFRRWVWQGSWRVLAVRRSRQRSTPSRSEVIDLNPGEWHQIREQPRSGRGKSSARKAGERKNDEAKPRRPPTGRGKGT